MLIVRLRLKWAMSTFGGPCSTRASIHRRPATLHHADLSAEITALIVRYLQPDPQP